MTIFRLRGVRNVCVDMQMKKIARRQSEDAQGGDKTKKTGKSNVKPRKTDDTAGHC